MNDNKDNILSKVSTLGKGSVGKLLHYRRDTPWLTVEETAEYLRCSLRFLREKVANKEVPHTRFGGKVLFHKERIDEWMLSMEEVLRDQEKEGENSKGETEQIVTTILPDVDRDKVKDLVQELINFNEHFVTGLGKNIAEDLKEYDFQKLSMKVYAQLSRWAHPNRATRRERKVKPIVHELSEILFGYVISRTKHPSYSN